eukprot:scaffold45844_cov49-Attheya_sp.AAC.2
MDSSSEQRAASSEQRAASSEQRNMKDENANLQILQKFFAKSRITIRSWLDRFEIWDPMLGGNRNEFKNDINILAMILYHISGTSGLCMHLYSTLSLSLSLADTRYSTVSFLPIT